ncbi:MAG: hypothetical protein ABR613_11745 [Actinomycetota bacterium]
MKDTNHHPTVELEHHGETVEIDEELAPLITEIWAAGIDTITSCQDVGEALADLIKIRPHLDRDLQGRAAIDFVSPDGLLDFFEAIANSGPRGALYVRMVHWAAPDAWYVRWQPDDLGIEETRDDGGVQPSSQFGLSPWVHLEFPRSDVPELTRRMKVFNSGELPPLGEIDWSTIEIDDSELQ